MSNRNGAKGTKWETAIVATLIDAGWPHAERRRLAGANDRGDIAGLPGVVIEAKNHNRVTLAEFVDEANTEAANANGAIGLAWLHRKGKGSPLDGYVVMDGRTALRLLREAGY